MYLIYYLLILPLNYYLFFWFVCFSSVKLLAFSRKWSDLDIHCLRIANWIGESPLYFSLT